MNLGIQLTWMDAKVGDHVVTPRYGKPVEIQALWYNALRVMEGLAHSFEQSAESRRYGVLQNGQKAVSTASSGMTARIVSTM